MDRSKDDLTPLMVVKATVITLQRCGEVKISSTATGLLFQVEGGHSNPGLDKTDLKILELNDVQWSESLSGWHIDIL